MAIVKTSTKGMTKEQWLEERKKSIGGSEIGGIIGTNPYSSAYSIWCERTGAFPAFEGNLATEVGTALEAFVADKFEDISDWTVERTNFLYRNDNFPHMHASPDRLIYRQEGGKKKLIAGLECKTTSAYNASKVHDVDFPVIYYAQCVQYMMVTELDTWYLAVLVGNSEYHTFMLTSSPDTVKPDWCEGKVFVPKSDMDSLVEAANEFWHLLETNTPPAPDGSDPTGNAIKKQYEGVVEGTADLWGQEKLLDRYTAAKEATKAAKKEEERLEQEIQTLLAGREYGECVGYKVKWKMQPGRQTFDSKTCIAKNPDMAEYLKEGKPFRKFEVKKL